MNATTKTPILSHLETMAKRAHNMTSFSPELRGEQMIKEYSEELTEDMEELTAGGATVESVNDYKNRYEKFFRSYLSAKSNTFSVMITGGSNFPVRRHEKANRSEHRHYEVFREWRLRAKKAIVRKAQPVKTFISELERYKSELEGMKVNHDLMKKANKILAKKHGDNIKEQIKEIFPTLSDFHIDWAIKYGFGLQNNNANMKRVEGRIKELEAKEGMRGENPITNYTFNGGTMSINYEIDRIQIMFEQRPTNDELTEWKRKGLNTFNWSPSQTAWQRKITANAMRTVKAMFTGITKI